MLELQRLVKRYGDVVAVDGVDLVVGRGELLVVVGASGSGKTTTLEMINRLVEPTSGRVLLAGRDVRDEPAYALRRRIGYVFQRIGLFPHLTVAENVAVVPRLLGWERRRVRRRTEELLELVQLPPDVYRERLPEALSGGQQQRVGLARALAAEPEVMLLDEPFGALDPLTRDALQAVFADLRRRLGLTALLVTHDVTEALLLADRIAVMSRGRLLQVGTPRELLRRPASGEVRELLETPRRRAASLVPLLGETPAGTDLEQGSADG